MPVLYIAIGSKNFFGAERRFFAISRKLREADFGGVQPHLIINSSLERAAERVDWASDLIQDLKRDKRLTVIPDHYRDLPRVRGLRGVADALSGRTHLHATLRARHLAYLKSLWSKSCSIEVTSPDTAEQVAQEAPVYALRRMRVIHCVSSTVARKLEALLPDSPIYDNIKSKITHSSTPFVELHDVNINDFHKENLIVSASRFIGRKNVKLVARALAMALDKLDGWRALVLGQGDEHDEIVDVLSSHIGAGNVEVRYEREMAGVFSRSRIYISMISPDNYPSQSVLEAMNHGNAVVLSNTGSSFRFIGEDRNGVLVDLDAEQAANAIVTLAGDPQELDRMGAASASYVRRQFSSKTHIEELLGVCGFRM